MSLMSPAFAGGFFTTSTTWEAQIAYNAQQHFPDKELSGQKMSVVLLPRNPNLTPGHKNFPLYRFLKVSEFYVLVLNR